MQVSAENVVGFLIDNHAIGCTCSEEDEKWCTGECAFNGSQLEKLRYFESVGEIPLWLFVPCEQLQSVVLLPWLPDNASVVKNETLEGKLVEDGDLFISLHQSLFADEVGELARNMGCREEVIDILKEQGIPGVFSYCSDFCGGPLGGQKAPRANDTPATISLQPSVKSAKKR